MSASNRKPILIVQGSQWGSEGKGMVAAALCERRKVDYAVRTGAVNAGHTVYKNGKKYVNQQLPTGWAAGDTTTLVIGPGAYIHPDIFHAEVKMVRGAGYQGQIWVDYRTGLHLPEHTDRAATSGRHYRIGATGKGCSEAIMDRIRKRGQEDGLLFRDYPQEPLSKENSWSFADTSGILNDAYDRGDQILLEGTQGSMLDLYLGPYPYTTHKQCIASQWVTEAGLSPSLDYEVVSVVRTYPIRVAGNSGPMPNEINWPTLAAEINHKLVACDKAPLITPYAILRFEEEYERLGAYPYASPQVEASERNRDAWRALPPDIQDELAKLFEFTTVTKKLRRVARLDLDALKTSVMIDRPAWMCLTFLNYEFPETWGDAEVTNLCLPKGAIEYMTHIEEEVGVPIGGYSIGPESRHFHYLSR